MARGQINARCLIPGNGWRRRHAVNTNSRHRLKGRNR
jgi:hypothetical protein